MERHEEVWLGMERYGLVWAGGCVDSYGEVFACTPNRISKCHGWPSEASTGNILISFWAGQVQVSGLTLRNRGSQSSLLLRLWAK